MKTKGKLSYIRLLVPVLLFAGVQIFAQPAADSRMAADPPSHKATTTSDPAMPLISDRTFMMKSIAAIAMNQSLESAPGCSSSNPSVGVTKASFLRGCPIPDCAAPPPGCFYQGPPDTGPNGCPIDCGHLVCNGGGGN